MFLILLSVPIFFLFFGYIFHLIFKNILVIDGKTGLFIQHQTIREKKQKRGRAQGEFGWNLISHPDNCPHRCRRDNPPHHYI